MQPLTLLTLATALCASSASATCFNSGAFWRSDAQKNDAISKLGSVCDKMKGTYKAGEVFTQCRNGIGGKYDFEARNQNNYAVSLARDVCITNLKRNIVNCDRGGYEVFSGLRMK